MGGGKDNLLRRTVFCGLKKKKKTIRTQKEREIYLQKPSHPECTNYCYTTSIGSSCYVGN